MLIGPQNLAENLARVRARIAAAAASAGRSEHSITLVGVSKAQPLETVTEAVGLGLQDLGENYPQEALAKIDALDAARRPPSAALSAEAAESEGPRWHFIGHLQSNKTRVVADRFAWVHGIDRASIAQRLSNQRGFYAPPLQVLLQVKLANEESKSGVLPADAAALAEAVAALPRLKLRGLMCIPPPVEDAQHQRQYFRRLRELLENLRSQGLDLDCLSMGMSADFEIAIQEGATHVRVGTALFGPRPVQPPAR
jgi:PLP dependent protein